jgi:CubicO group peptidase (beta-lactamase class C family)
MRHLLLLALLWLTPVLAEPPPKTTQQTLTRLVATAKSSRSDTLLIVRNGKVLAEYHSSGSPPEPIELMSVTKGFVALAVGLLLREGKIESLDAPVHTFFPEWKQGRKQLVTLRMLMSHTSGLQNVANAGLEIYPARDTLQLALAAELDADPGTKLSYNNKAVNLLAGIVAKAAGVPIDAYLQQSLFEPMAIKPGKWATDAAGNRNGMAGLPLLASDLAKIGQLVLDEGRWQQRQLLPESFVQEMLAPQPLGEEFGLLWLRPSAWYQMHVSAESLTKLRGASASDAVVSALETMRDRRFGSIPAFFEAAGRALGGDGRQLLAREVSDRGLKLFDVFNLNPGPVLHVLEGYLGQYLVIAPGANVIAVRQIKYRDDWQESDGNLQFVEQVGELAATFDTTYRKP